MPAQRRADIDWLLTLAVLLLVPFHTARIFDVFDPFYAKSAELSWPLSFLVAFLNPWHMPLLFVLAGASSWFALRRRSGGRYLHERLLRLLVPFLFGVAVVVPPQAYYGRLTHAGDPGSSLAFLDFYPSFFVPHLEDMSGYFGTFTPAHLWFILFLFLFSLLCLPLFLRWRTSRPEVSLLASVCQRRGVIFLLALPLALADAMPDLGGKVAPFYLLLFVYGYLLVADARLQRAVDRHVWWGLGLGALTTTAYLLVVAGALEPPRGLLMHMLRAYNAWFWVVALLGLGHRFLGASNRLLSYASEASYPFYILHQTVIVSIGYYVVQLDLPLAVRFVLIAALATTVSLAGYELVVRRLNVLRLAFGLKPNRSAPSAGVRRRQPGASMVDLPSA